MPALWACRGDTATAAINIVLCDPTAANPSAIGGSAHTMMRWMAASAAAAVDGGLSGWAAAAAAVDGGLSGWAAAASAVDGGLSGWAAAAAAGARARTPARRRHGLQVCSTIGCVHRSEDEEKKKNLAEGVKKIKRSSSGVCGEDGGGRRQGEGAARPCSLLHLSFLHARGLEEQVAREAATTSGGAAHGCLPRGCGI